MPGDAVKCPWCNGDLNTARYCVDCGRRRNESRYIHGIKTKLGLDRRDGIYNDCEEIADYMEENSWT